MNSYLCYQPIRFFCKEYLNSKNTAGEIFLQNNKTIKILDEKSNCFLTKQCSCDNQGNASLIDSLNIESKYLPIQKICVQKRNNDTAEAYIGIYIDNFRCETADDYLSSSNDVLTDTNLQTCTKLTDLNRVYFKYIKKSSMEIFIYIKRRREPMNCKDIEIYQKDKNVCRDKFMRQKCSFINFKYIISMPMKICKYICQTGMIEELLIFKKYQIRTPVIEICEIYTSHLEISFRDRLDIF